MPKPGKKPSPAAPGKQPARPGNPMNPFPPRAAKTPDRRWQRTKRYGWDSR